MPKRLLRLLAIFFALAFLAAACGGDDDDASGDDDDTQQPDDASGDDDTGDTGDTGDVERAYGGEVTVGLEAEATGLRPWDDSLSEDPASIALTLFDPLMAQTSEGDFQGFLAESLTPNEDLTVWTMKLREGVLFHNGVELTAQTIVDMFELQKEGTAGSGIIATVKLTSVEATGDYEVTYTLEETNAGFPSYLAGPQIGYVFEPAAAAADPDAFNDNPVGTGAFTLESRDIDNETVVARNPNYWMTDAEGNQLPYLDKVKFRPIPDETTRLQSLTSGTVNAFTTRRQAPIRDAREAAQSTDMTLLEFQGNNSGGGHFNTAVAPYDDVRVRQGLTLLNNQDAVIKALGGEGISDPATQFFSPDSPYYSEAVAEAWPTFDVAAGTAKLQEYVDDPERSDGKSVGEAIDVELSCPPDPTLLAAMAVLEQVWTSTGLVNVDLSNYDQATHINLALGLDNGLIGEHGAHCWRWGGEGDPSAYLDTAFGGPIEAVAGNMSNWTSDEMQALLKEGRSTTDVDERKAIYEKVGLLIAENVPVWFSGHTATLIATDSDIHGLDIWTLPDGTLGNGHPGALARWNQAWIAQA